MVICFVFYFISCLLWDNMIVFCVIVIIIGRRKDKYFFIIIRIGIKVLQVLVDEFQVVCEYFKIVYIIFGVGCIYFFRVGINKFFL